MAPDLRFHSAALGLELLGVVGATDAWGEGSHAGCAGPSPRLVQAVTAIFRVTRWSTGSCWTSVAASPSTVA